MGAVWVHCRGFLVRINSSQASQQVPFFFPWKFHCDSLLGFVLSCGVSVTWALFTPIYRMCNEINTLCMVTKPQPYCEFQLFVFHVIFCASGCCCRLQLCCKSSQHKVINKELCCQMHLAEELVSAMARPTSGSIQCPAGLLHALAFANQRFFVWLLYFSRFIALGRGTNGKE